MDDIFAESYNKLGIYGFCCDSLKSTLNTNQFIFSEKALSIQYS